VAWEDEKRVTTADYGSLIRDLLVGVGVFLSGLGIFVAMLALARTLRRLNVTLDGVDRQVESLGPPVAKTLNHVDGIANTADQTLARLGGVVGSLEDVASNVSETATLTKNALTPAIVNVGATVSGVSAGLRRLVTGKKSTDQP
jgi:uncharacterized protein YoxC